MSRQAKRNLTGIVWLFLLAVGAGFIGLIYAICPEFAICIIGLTAMFVGGVYMLYKTVG